MQNPIRRASFLRFDGNDLLIGEELQNKIFFLNFLQKKKQEL